MFADAEFRVVVTDTVTGAAQAVSESGYRPWARLSRHLLALDRTCGFPGCGATVWFCDVEHSTPHDLAEYEWDEAAAEHVRAQLRRPRPAPPEQCDSPDARGRAATVLSGRPWPADLSVSRCCDAGCRTRFPRVGEHHPRRLALADVDSLGSVRQQPGDLARRVQGVDDHLFPVQGHPRS